MDDSSFYMAAVSRLLGEYQQAIANRYRPDTDTAIARLTEIRDRVERALALVEKKPIERLAYRAAFYKIIAADGAEPDAVQVAHEAIAPYVEWKAVSEDLGFDSPADRAARGV